MAKMNCIPVIVNVNIDGVDTLSVEMDTSDITDYEAKLNNLDAWWGEFISRLRSAMKELAQ